MNDGDKIIGENVTTQFTVSGGAAREPTEEALKAAKFAWNNSKHVSNPNVLMRNALRAAYAVDFGGSVAPPEERETVVNRIHQILWELRVEPNDDEQRLLFAVNIVDAVLRGASPGEEARPQETDGKKLFDRPLRRPPTDAEIRACLLAAEDYCEAQEGQPFCPIWLETLRAATLRGASSSGSGVPQEDEDLSITLPSVDGAPPLRLSAKDRLRLAAQQVTLANTMQERATASAREWENAWRRERGIPAVPDDKQAARIMSCSHARGFDASGCCFECGGYNPNFAPSGVGAAAEPTGEKLEEIKAALDMGWTIDSEYVRWLVTEVERVRAVAAALRQPQEEKP